MVLLSALRLPFVITRPAALAMTLAAVAALAGATWHWRVSNRSVQAMGVVQQLQSRLQAVPSANAAPASTGDFVQQLPATVSVEPVVRELQRASGALAVTLVSVSVNPRDPTARTLGRVELIVTLKGAYPKLKAVLARTQDRFPGLLLQRLSMQRAGAPTEVEARASLLLLTQALQVSGGSP
jgi:hypothetical protein